MENGIVMQFFHSYYPADGSLWDHARDKAQELAALGFTSVWLPPASKGSTGADANGYDAYDLYDLGEFDQKGSVRTRYGTKAAYIAAIQAFEKAGIGVYADIVLNHKAGADETERVPVIKVDAENRNSLLEPLDIQAYTRFTFPGRKSKYSTFIWDFRCFTGVDYAADTNQTGIFKIRNDFAYGWQQVVGSEKGNFDYLMFADVEFRNASVREEIKQWGQWLLREAPFTGVRLDAIKHMPPAFINEWLDHMRALQPGLFAVGEYWAPEDLPVMLKYLEATQGRIALFDAPLHNNFFQASNKGAAYDLTGILKNCLLEAAPVMAVTLVDNHDTQPLQTLETPVQHWFKPLAYALILLRQAGYPCVFYPDLYGARYVGPGKDGTDHAVTLEPCPHLDKLLLARKQYAYGSQRDYFDEPACIGWTREGSEDHPGSGCAVILSNGHEAAKRMELGTAHAGKTMFDWLGIRQENITLDENGRGDFPVSAGSLAVWVCCPPV